MGANNWNIWESYGGANDDYLNDNNEDDDDHEDVLNFQLLYVEGLFKRILREK